MICMISGKETNRMFKTYPVHKEVYDFAIKNRDVLNYRSTRQFFNAMLKLKKTKTWEEIKAFYEQRLLEVKPVEFLPPQERTLEMAAAIAKQLENFK